MKHILCSTKSVAGCGVGKNLVPPDYDRFSACGWRGFMKGGGMCLHEFKTDYRKAEIFGEKALFANFRLDPETLPIGIIAYELREHELDFEYNECGEPNPPKLSIAKSVWCDHFGTVLLWNKIETVESGEKILEDGDWGFFDDEVSLSNGLTWLNQ